MRNKKKRELAPGEQVEPGVSRNNEFVAGELLTRLHDNEPAFFEQAVLEVRFAYQRLPRPQPYAQDSGPATLAPLP